MLSEFQYQDGNPKEVGSLASLLLLFLLSFFVGRMTGGADSAKGAWDFQLLWNIMVLLCFVRETGRRYILYPNMFNFNKDRECPLLFLKTIEIRVVQQWKHTLGIKIVAKLTVSFFSGLAQAKYVTRHCWCSYMICQIRGDKCNPPI